jgi:hypothetical protein
LARQGLLPVARCAWLLPPSSVLLQPTALPAAVSIEKAAMSTPPPGSPLSMSLNQIEAGVSFSLPVPVP